MMMMMMPLPKVGLGKGDPGEGSLRVGKALGELWEPRGAQGAAPLPAVPDCEGLGRILQLGRGFLPFLWQFLLLLAFPAFSKQKAETESQQ